MSKLIAALLALSLLTGCATSSLRIGFGGALLADGGSTEWALNTGKYKEANPVLQGLTITLLFGVAMVADLVAQHEVKQGNEKDARIIYTVGTIAHSLAAGWNLGQMARNR